MKNFFDVLRQGCEEDIMGVLNDLVKAGHFVAVDYKTTPLGKKVLNRFFVAFVVMKDLYR